MQQVSHAEATTEASARTLADAALTYLAPLADSTGPHAFSSKHIFEPTLSQRADEAAPAIVTPQTNAEVGTLQAPFPSLLQYVDHILLRDKNRHNCPPHPAQRCVICNLQWDKVSIPSTFLPLSPCNHWVHYRCLIELASRAKDSRRGKCCKCNTPLYEWDGINTLTLATRTDLPMEYSQGSAIDTKTYAPVVSDQDEYEQDCDFIEKTIERNFFRQLANPSDYSDQSPHLVQSFNDTLNELRILGRPTSKWLKWNTTTGPLLFGMLVAIKMQRFLTEKHGRIKQTEAWVAWEEGCRVLQARILEDVHRE